MTPADGIRNDLRVLDQTVARLVQLSSAPGEPWVRAAAEAFHIGQFYSGIESVLEKILKLFDMVLPEVGGRYHAELIALAIQNGFIAQSQIELLKDLRGFRHFIRHAYGVLLNEDETHEKVAKVIAAWPELKAHLLRKLN